jgi:hypothetical protein
MPGCGGGSGRGVLGNGGSTGAAMAATGSGGGGGGRGSTRRVSVIMSFAREISAMSKSSRASQR